MLERQLGTYVPYAMALWVIVFSYYRIGLVRIEDKLSRVIDGISPRS